MGGSLKTGYQLTSDISLVRRLGAGGMGTVWLAQNTKLGAEVVVKFLSEALAADPEACARFSREVTATIQVRSPHVVQIFDHGITEAGVPYLVMELLEGQDLAKILRQRGTLRPDEAMHIIEGVASALTKAHERGIIHRDIKPANVFLCSANPRPFVKLVDFGIAKRLEDETMTATNAMLGTPAYMSPEQLDTSNVLDHRADLWALGVLAYHMLSGSPPFKGANFMNIAHAVLVERETPRITLHRSELPAAIDGWFERALAREPANRFSSARELADALALALGDLAYPSTRKLASTGSTPKVVQPTPSGAILYPADSAPSFDGEGSTLGASSITQTTVAASARTKWWLAGAMVLGLILIGLAGRIGYGLRNNSASASASASAATASASAAAPALLPATSAIPTSSTPAIASAPPATSASVVAPSKPTRPGPAPRRPTTTTAPRKEDDIGF